VYKLIRFAARGVLFAAKVCKCGACNYIRLPFLITHTNTGCTLCLNINKSRSPGKIRSSINPHKMARNRRSPCAGLLLKYIIRRSLITSLVTSSLFQQNFRRLFCKHKYRLQVLKHQIQHYVVPDW
jgi:hypothetical protein